MAGRREDRVLGLALARGLVSLRDVRVAAAAAGGESPSGPGARRGSALEELVRLGALSREQLETLDADVDATPGSGSPFAPPGTLPETPPDGLAPRRYEVESLIGEGGMGQVFRARDLLLKRRVAVKFLNREDEAATERFLQEARAQARVEHENVGRVYDAGELEGRPFIAMQLVDGPPLSEAARGMTREQRVEVVRKVAEAVHAAHRQGLIHRDLKPANILVERRDGSGLHPVVVDFGLARELGTPGRTATGVFAGTPYYMAPEQVKGDSSRLDRRTDVYSLGATLYEVLSGKKPFDGTSTVEVFLKLVQDEPEPLRRLVPDLPADLDTIVSRCLEKEPSRRYDSARALAEDLGRWLDGEPILARRAGAFERLARRVRKNRALAAAVAAAVLLLAAFLALFVRSRVELAARTEAAARFGRDVTEIENLLRLSRMLPLHDTTREKRLVASRMDAIRERMEELGGAARGPGAYALGRGALALGDPAAARRQLEAARAAGWSGPETADALGTALAELWRRERAAASRIGNRPSREARLAEIDRTLRTPALAALREGRAGTLSAPELAEGRLALLDGKAEEALRLASAAVEKVPWLYEAHLLAGEARLVRGNGHRGKGEAASAAKEYDAADEAYRAALTLAPSDAAAWGGLAEALLERMQIGRFAGAEVEPVVARVVEAAKKGAVADPARADLPAIEALAWLRLGEEQWFGAGKDPSGALANGEAAARRALSLDPAGVEPNDVVGQALLLRGDVASETGGDPRPLYEGAVAAFERALASNPAAGGSVLNLGLAWNGLARWQSGKGVDPRPAFKQALDANRRAIALDPNDANRYLHLGGTSLYLANVEAARGGDPTPYWDQSAQAFGNAVERNPKSSFGWNGAGLVPYSRAKWNLKHGKAALADLEKAEGPLAKSRELNPKDPFTLFNLANLERVRGAALSAEGKDARPAFAAARRFFGEGLARSGTRASVFADRVSLAAIEARDAVRAGRDPAPAIAAGRSDLATSLKLDPSSAEARRFGGELEIVAAEWAAARGRVAEARAGRARARDLLEAAAKADRDSAETFLTLAQVWLLEARAESGAKADAACVAGLAAAEKALAIDGKWEDARSTLAALSARRAALAGSAAAGTN